MGKTRFKLQGERKGEVGVKVWGTEVWNGANVEALWTFEGAERWREGIKESLRAHRAGVAIGGRWQALNIASFDFFLEK